METNWKWFEENFKWIAISLVTIVIISKIDIWVNGTEKSTFLSIISPFTKSLIVDFLLLLLILLVVLYFNHKHQNP